MRTKEKIDTPKLYDFILAHRPISPDQVGACELQEFKSELNEIIDRYGIQRRHIMKRTVKIWVIPTAVKADLIREIVAVACKTNCSFVMTVLPRPFKPTERIVI